jgi:hypothetical protein
LKLIVLCRCVIVHTSVSVCVCNWYEEFTTATRIESNNSFSYWLEW